MGGSQRKVGVRVLEQGSSKLGLEGSAHLRALAFALKHSEDPTGGAWFHSDQLVPPLWESRQKRN